MKHLRNLIGSAMAATGKFEEHCATLAETINGLYKAELVHCRAPLKAKWAGESATLEWV